MVLRWVCLHVSAAATMFLAHVVILPAAFGQAVIPGMGSSVLTKEGAVLRMGERVIERSREPRVYRVEAVKNEWLWVVADQVKGWVRSSEVVPLDGAMAYFNNEIRNDPKSVYGYLARGLLWDRQGDYARAIADYSGALTIDPRDKRIYLARGRTWRKQGDDDKAIADFTEAIRLDPADAVAYHDRGLAWESKGELDIALSDLSDMVSLRPRDFKAYIDRGIAWQRKGDYDRAIADFNESIRQEPRNAFAYNDRGNAWRAKRDYDRALADYNEALKHDPAFVWAYINRGLAWAAKHEFDRAIADEDRAIQLDPDNLYAFNNRAIFWGNLGEYARARDDFQQALRRDPKFQAARSGLALLLASCPDATFRDGKKALELASEAYKGARPQEPFYSSTLAAAYAETGDFPHAVEYQEKAIRLATAEAEKDELRSRLALYQASKPFRQVKAVK